MVDVFFFLSMLDDIIIIRDDAPGIIAVKQALGQSFDIKDLSPLRYFLGIEIARSRREICLSQRRYTRPSPKYGYDGMSVSLHIYGSES